MAFKVTFTDEERAKWARGAQTRRISGEGESLMPILGWLVGSPFALAGPEAQILSSVTAFPPDQLPSISTAKRSIVEAAAEADALRSLLPGGITVIGCFCAEETGRGDSDAAVGHSSLAYASEIAERVLSELRGQEGDTLSFLVLQLPASAEGGSLAEGIKAYKCEAGGVPEEVGSGVVEGGPEKLWSSFWGCHRLISLGVIFHLHVYAKGPHDFDAALDRAMTPVLESIQSRDATWVLRFVAGSGQQAKEAAAVVCPGSTDDTSLGALLGVGTAATQGSGWVKGKQPSAGTRGGASVKKLPSPVLATLVANTPSTVAPQVPGQAPEAMEGPCLAFYKAPAGALVLRRRLQVHAVACAPLSLGAREALLTLLAPAAAAQLTTMRHLLCRSLVADQSRIDPKLCAYQFCPQGFIHPVSALYSLAFGEVESSSVAQRKALHVRLGLPLNRPLLRVANALAPSLSASGPDSSSSQSGTKGAGSKRLPDVHMGLAPSGVTGGKVWAVRGSYDYYHYMQDRIDDSGWGCAYRSLQTIVSWFRHQQYSDVQVPSHRKIQETLVEIGDKDPSFVGSSQWIGAIELSYVLDQLLGVSCKVLTVQSGMDMPTKARELARHFETHGSPVMIGGGVLAYTLLGIDYNELTGECAFLILDPHYMGGEDLKSIRQGGWCGWKKSVTASGKDFFVRDAFYNLLLPQCPETV